MDPKGYRPVRGSAPCPPPDPTPHPPPGPHRSDARPDHVQVAVTLGNLGGAWGELGQAGRAKDLLERALAIEEREYGPDHVEVARTLVNL
ncbi:MAG: tetratricopeptide repeat protein, partial [Actinobacteria bacterium]|nr:tetratricopeptide repeat protein [Actinomycetota bacterium]